MLNDLTGITVKREYRPIMRSPEIVDSILRKQSRSCLRWCPVGENLTIGQTDACACIGCINYIVSKEEWLNWCKRYNYCKCCSRFDKDIFYQEKE
jgi:hypothetical protein